MTLLWRAGQERLFREGRARLGEMYRAVADAVVAADVRVGRVKARGDLTPWYAKTDAPSLDAAGQRATFSRLAAMFPGQVVRRPS